MNKYPTSNQTMSSFKTSIVTFISKPTVKKIFDGYMIGGTVAAAATSVAEKVKRYRVAKYYKVIYDDRININNALANAVDKKIENDDSIGLMDLSEFYNYPVAEVPQYEEPEYDEASIFGKFIRRITKNKWFSDIGFFNATVDKFDKDWTPESTIIWAQNHGVLDDEVLDAVNAYTADADIYNDSIAKYERFVVPATKTLKIMTVLGVFADIIGLIALVIPKL